MPQLKELVTMHEEISRILAEPHPKPSYRSPIAPLTWFQRALRRELHEQVSHNLDEFTMNDWVFNYAKVAEGGEVRSCKTTRCVAGWAVHLAGVPDRQAGGEDLTTDQWEALGILLMGLTDAEYWTDLDGLQTELFYESRDNALERIALLAGA